MAQWLQNLGLTLVVPPFLLSVTLSQFNQNLPEIRNTVVPLFAKVAVKIRIIGLSIVDTGQQVLVWYLP